MTTAFVEQARAKINLTLRVNGRRADGYHDLESLVVFADLADTLAFEAADVTMLDVTGPYAAASGATADNLVLKAYRALAANIAGLKGGRFILDKQLPVAAGIGGGSADAAAALRHLARGNGIAFDDARLMLAALRTGADVPVCLASRACIMTGVGERLSPPLRLPAATLCARLCSGLRRRASARRRWTRRWPRWAPRMRAAAAASLSTA